MKNTQNFEFDNEIEVKEEIFDHEITKNIKLEFLDENKKKNSKSESLEEIKKFKNENENFSTFKNFKKEPKRDFLALPFKNPEIPKLIKKEVLSKKNSQSLINFSCDNCGKNFRLKSKLRSHIKVHLDKIECEICHIKMKPVNLKNHIKIYHNGKSEEKCKICDKIVRNLKRHLKVHQTLKFECKICGKKFRFEKLLKDHMEFHENPEKFTCQICGYKSIEPGNVKRHSMIHKKNVERKHKCNQCGYKTNEKGNLLRHLKRHKKLDLKFQKLSKAVKCEKCLSVLKDKAAYQIHLYAVHTEKEKFECDLCGAKLKYKMTFKVHLNEMHGKNVK